MFLGNLTKVFLIPKNKISTQSVKQYSKIQNNFTIHKIMQI